MQLYIHHSLLNKRLKNCFSVQNHLLLRMCSAEWILWEVMSVIFSEASGLTNVMPLNLLAKRPACLAMHLLLVSNINIWGREILFCAPVFYFGFSFSSQILSNFRLFYDLFKRWVLCNHFVSSCPFGKNSRGGGCHRRAFELNILQTKEVEGEFRLTWIQSLKKSVSEMKVGT